MSTVEHYWGSGSQVRLLTEVDVDIRSPEWIVSGNLVSEILRLCPTFRLPKPQDTSFATGSPAKSAQLRQYGYPIVSTDAARAAEGAERHFWYRSQSIGGDGIQGEQGPHDPDKGTFVESSRNRSHMIALAKSATGRAALSKCRATLNHGAELPIGGNDASALVVYVENPQQSFEGKNNIYNRHILNTDNDPIQREGKTNKILRYHRPDLRLVIHSSTVILLDEPNSAYSENFFQLSFMLQFQNNDDMYETWSKLIRDRGFNPKLPVGVDLGDEEFVPFIDLVGCYAGYFGSRPLRLNHSLTLPPDIPMGTYSQLAHGICPIVLQTLASLQERV